MNNQSQIKVRLDEASVNYLRWLMENDPQNLIPQSAPPIEGIVKETIEPTNPHQDYLVTIDFQPLADEQYLLKQSRSRKTEHIFCKYCESSFIGNNRYVQHLQEHSQCPFCGSSGNLRKIIFHTNEQIQDTVNALAPNPIEDLMLKDLLRVSLCFDDLVHNSCEETEYAYLKTTEINNCLDNLWGQIQLFIHENVLYQHKNPHDIATEMCEELDQYLDKHLYIRKDEVVQFFEIKLKLQRSLSDQALINQKITQED